MSEYFVVSADGTMRAVDEDDFQQAIDSDLAQYNDGIVPTTDDERTAILKRIKWQQ